MTAATATTTAATVRARVTDLIDGGTPADVAFADRLIVSYLQRWPVLLSRLADAITEMDTEVAAYRAHALKGAAGNLGAAAAAELCADAEALATAARWDDLAPYPHRLRAALRNAADELTLVLVELRG
ncbi:hypothetical protein GCM10009682_45350 [Luedemannella flava]|uniref:HPt domain-containing protein n=1 Tax=Luedemannella flava TaxID=349316 RepID=A0ABP4YJH6_9ACTN